MAHARRIDIEALARIGTEAGARDQLFGGGIAGQNAVDEIEHRQQSRGVHQRGDPNTRDKRGGTTAEQQSPAINGHRHAVQPSACSPCPGAPST